MQKQNVAEGPNKGLYTIGFTDDFKVHLEQIDPFFGQNLPNLNDLETWKFKLLTYFVTIRIRNTMSKGGKR